MTEQPMPTSGGMNVTPVARRIFFEMLDSRERKGIATYGTTLQTFNGRDAVQDALEEAADLWQYLTQIALERDADAALMRSLRADDQLLTTERDSLRWQLKQAHQQLVVP